MTTFGTRALTTGIPPLGANPVQLNGQPPAVGQHMVIPTDANPVGIDQQAYGPTLIHSQQIAGPLPMPSDASPMLAMAAPGGMPSFGSVPGAAPDQMPMQMPAQMMPAPQYPQAQYPVPQAYGPNRSLQALDAELAKVLRMLMTTQKGDDPALFGAFAGVIPALRALGLPESIPVFEAWGRTRNFSVTAAGARLAEQA